MSATVLTSSGTCRRSFPFALGDLCSQKRRHAVPSLVGARHIVSGAALVGKGMRRVVAIDLMRDPRRFERPFQLVDRSRRAPIVLVRKMTLERHAGPGRVGELLGRD